VIQRMRHNRNTAVNPIAASKFAVPRCFRILMKTLYVASRVMKPERARWKLAWPVPILMVEPVMNAAIALRGMS